MAKDPVVSISALLSYYSFDLNGYDIDQLVKGWLEEYSSKWVMAAVVEAIFQGRYKAASVDNILLNWYLSGRPQHHFDSEFADLVCSKLLKKIPSEPEEKVVAPPKQSFVTVLDPPATAAPSETSNPYSVSYVTPTPKSFNQGMGKWLRFVTKL